MVSVITVKLLKLKFHGLLKIGEIKNNKYKNAFQ